MDVSIVEIKSNRSIVVYPIQLGGTLGRVEKDYFDEAWRCAVDDQLVFDHEKEMYRFEFVK